MAHDHSGMDMSMGSMSIGNGIPALTEFPKIYLGLVGGVVGVAAIANLSDIIICRQRLAAARNGQPTPSKPKSLPARINATATAIAREAQNATLDPIKIGRFQIRMPTVGKVSLIVANIIVLVVLCLVGFSDTQAFVNLEPIGYRTGWVSLAQIPLLFLLAAKTNIIGFLTGMSYERINWLHRWCARCLLLTSTIHFGYWLTNWWPYGSFAAKKLRTDPITYRGLIAWVFLVWIVFSSMAPIRGWKYEFFLIQHLMTFAVFIGMVYIHTPADCHVYIWIPVGLFFFDRVARGLRVLYANISYFHPKQRREGSMKGLWACNAEFTSLPQNTTRITINNPPISWNAGQHVFLSCYSVVPLQSHPFTIASIPEDGKIEFYVKTEKGATKKFNGHAEKLLLLPDSHAPMVKSVAIEGPYGQIRPLRQFDSVIFFAGSTGATFTMPLLRDIVTGWKQGNGGGTWLRPAGVVTRHVRFVWVVKSRGQLSWFASQLSTSINDVARLRAEGLNVDVEVSVYCTCDDEFTEEHKSILQSSGYSHEKRPSATYGKGNPEEPDLNLENLMSEKEGLFKRDQIDTTVQDIDSKAESRAGEVACRCTADIVDEDRIKSEANPCCCGVAAETARRPDSLSSSIDSTCGMLTRKLLIHPDIAVFSGRPVPRNIIRKVLEQAYGESAVVCCGPQGLVDDVRSAVVRLSDERAVHKGTGAQATTSTRAKASFKKNGPRLPEHEMRRIARGATLDRRAEELRERDAKRKRAREKARAKEARDREGRAKIGLGLATQLAGFSHTQKAMKGAMEGFLGVKKIKENSLKGKENTIVDEDEGRASENDVEVKKALLQDAIEQDIFDEEVCLEEAVRNKEGGQKVEIDRIPEESNDRTGAIIDARTLLEAVDADMFDDDICLEELLAPACEQESSAGVRLGIPRSKELPAAADAVTDQLTKFAPSSSPIISQLPDPLLCSKQAADYCGGLQLNMSATEDSKNKQDSKVDASTYTPPNPLTVSPTRPAPSLTESQCISPPDIWVDMFATGTQIGRELSQPKTPGVSFINGIGISQDSVGDLEAKSDDPLNSAENISNPVISSAHEGVVVHDFAYFKQTLSQNIVLGDRVIPKSPSSFGSLKRKRGCKFPNAMVTPSPKTTSNCVSFTEAQVSFTTDLTRYGYSTQIAESMFDDESDTDEEDFSFQAQPASKRFTNASTQKDRELMPPPPLRNPPKVFKPPSKAISSPEPGLGIGIWGVSTQDIRAVFIDEDGSDTEEDEFGSSIFSPSFMPKAPQSSKTVAVDYATFNVSQLRPEASLFIEPVAKKARLASTTQLPRQIQPLRSVPSSKICTTTKTAPLERSISAPPHHVSPAPNHDLHELGISTQILHDFAEEDVELSPTETRKEEKLVKKDEEILRAIEENHGDGDGCVMPKSRACLSVDEEEMQQMIDDAITNDLDPCVDRDDSGPGCLAKTKTPTKDSLETYPPPPDDRLPKDYWSRSNWLKKQQMDARSPFRGGGGMQVHAVPDGERATVNGQQLPWAYEYADPDRTSRLDREKGPFGRSTRRRTPSRSKTATPSSRAQDKDAGANWQVIDDIFARAKETDGKEQQRASSTPAVGSITAPETTQPSPVGQPTEAIIYGFPAAFQYAAIDFYERVSQGAIYEDYERFPPHTKYDLSLSLRQARGLGRISQEALRKKNQYDGGEHWIKVTFDSAEAAERACYYSPHVIKGYLVYAEPYRGSGPTNDEAILATPAAVASATASPSQRSSATLQNHTPGRTPSVTASSATATTALQDPFASIAPSPLAQSLAAQNPTPSTGRSTALATEQRKPPRIRGAKRAVLLPAESALLPSATTWQKFANVPIVNLFIGGGSDVIGHQVPRKEDGTFDWDNASVYWKFWFCVDYYCWTDWLGLKGDD
ncbi:hypothetical protein FKW77_005359 [Venturia effusa]|uniref:ferric-chelate reductase (NADPH) n=1 Tax=Venturia effusa TaxID=50376 RepID=A0A517L398_9PEZI|nr:hypothetical protein FKW77_005359 [Venturia effusa]